MSFLNQISGFCDRESATHYDFLEPLNFPSVYMEDMGVRRIEYRRQGMAHDAVATRVAVPTAILNQAQSTHTASVHKSVTQSLQRLNCRYSPVNIDKNIAAIRSFAQRITEQNFGDTSSLEREAAIRFIARMDTLFNNKEAGSQLTIKHILALIWEAAHDRITGTLKCDIHTVEESFIKHLYEIQRGYNLDLKGSDLGGGDRPICVGGTINKLTDTLNAGIHDDVEIIYITKETAGEKLKALVKEKAVAFVKNSIQKRELMSQIDELKTADQIPTWDIPEFISNSIQDEVNKSFIDEFESSLMPAQLEEVFLQFTYISFDEKTYMQLRKENSADNVVTVIDEKAEADERSLHSNVNDSPELVLSETASTMRPLDRGFQSIRLNAEKPRQLSSNSHSSAQSTRTAPSEQKRGGIISIFQRP